MTIDRFYKIAVLNVHFPFKIKNKIKKNLSTFNCN